MKGSRTVTLNAMQMVARLVRLKFAGRLQGLGLYAGQETVVLLLAEKDGVSLGYLAERLIVKPPTITKTIIRLSNQGFVVKKTSVEDQRQIEVYLTPEGRRIIAELEELLRKTEREVLQGFNEKECRTLLRFVRRIERNISQGMTDNECNEPSGE